MIEVRFFVVLAPALCILCSHSLLYISNSTLNKNLLTFAILLFSFTLIFLIPSLTMLQNWEASLFRERIIIPSLILLFLLIFFEENNSLDLIKVGIIVLILFSTLPNKIIQIHNREIAGSSARRFRPFAENSSVLQYSPEMRMLISPDIYAQHQMLGRDRESNLWMYSLILLEKASLEQFDYEQYDQNFLLTSEYDHIFLSDQEWESIDERTKDSILLNWSILIKNEYTLLSKKENSSG